VLQLLPVNEMAPGAQSPYSAISAMAIDPLYVCVPAVADFRALGGETSLSQADRAALADARSSSVVCYAAVRDVKRRALTGAYGWFRDHEWSRGTARAHAFERYAAAQAWWLNDYGVFRAIHASQSERPWTLWPEGLARCDRAVLGETKAELADAIRFRQYLQWIADTQWHAARASARAYGVELFGDLPFMVDGDSADVWAHAECFRLDASVGAPPDAFSATGQDWGMPVYRWEGVAATDYQWLRDRARRSADLFDGYRVDHVVGFYRTYGRPRAGGEPFFTPSSEDEQVRLGERVLSIFRAAGAEIIAEDLGTVPGFVRASLARLNVAGFCVARWERAWHRPGQPFHDPADYPPRSVAVSGTHDTEPMVAWWQQATREERALACATPTMIRLARGENLVDAPYNPDVRDALLEALFASRSDLLLLQVQDVFGSSERINVPSTVSPANWAYRLPWPSDRLDDVVEVTAARDRLLAWSRRYGRT
jgi:4-alpha-glucanotransferase